jgi:hypothetical protein
MEESHCLWAMAEAFQAALETSSIAELLASIEEEKIYHEPYPRKIVPTVEVLEMRLHMACDAGRLDVLEALIERGVGVNRCLGLPWEEDKCNAPDRPWEQTPLHRASSLQSDPVGLYDPVGLVRKLLDAGADINFFPENNIGTTAYVSPQLGTALEGALDDCCYVGDVSSSVWELLSRGARGDLNIMNVSLSSLVGGPLSKVCSMVLQGAGDEQQMIELAEAIVDNSKSDNTDKSWMASGLIVAAGKGDRPTLVRRLIEMGAEVDPAPTPCLSYLVPTQSAPLTVACLSNLHKNTSIEDNRRFTKDELTQRRMDTVRVLINHGASSDLLSSAPVRYCIYSNTEDIKSLPEGSTALHAAYAASEFDVAAQLTAAGV